jgi:hypothetical protein
VRGGTRVTEPQENPVPLFDSRAEGAHLRARGSEQAPSRELVYAVEHLADDYGLDSVRAAVAELTEWYAHG